jgi:alkaline phosphatase D
MAANPHVRGHNARRGYMTCEVTRDAWRTDYRLVPYVTRPDAPVATAASFGLAHGRAVVERT